MPSLAVLLLSWLPLTAGQLSVTFLDTAVMVKEGDQFTLRVQKSGPVTQVINVIVSVSYLGFPGSIVTVLTVNIKGIVILTLEEL